MRTLAPEVLTSTFSATSSAVPRMLRNAALTAEGLMSKPPRDHASIGTNTYFVTTGAWGHRSLLQSERMANLLVDTLLHYRREQKYLLHEFVVMPNHLHLMFTPCGITLERVMQFVKGGFSNIRGVLGVVIRIADAMIHIAAFPNFSV